MCRRSRPAAASHDRDAELHRHLLAALEGLPAAARPPSRSPDADVRRLTRWARWIDAVLGLGGDTGLLGPLPTHVAGRIDGVDLSPPMLAKARALGVCDHLDEAELGLRLHRADRRDDAVVAADGSIDVGDLEPVFASVQRVIEPGDHFVFSIERADDAHDDALLPSRRYAQSERRAREPAARHGFDVPVAEPGPIRDDQRQTVHGLYVDLRRRG